MNTPDRNGSHGERVKTTTVTRLRKLSLEKQPVISRLVEQETSRKESHQSLSSSLSSLPASLLSPRPDRRHLHHLLPKGSPRFNSQRHHSDLDVRNPKVCRQSEITDGCRNRRQNSLDDSGHGNGDLGNDDVMRSARKMSRSNSLPVDSLSVDSLIDQWTFEASKLQNPVRLPLGSEPFQAVMDEMTTTPRKEDQGADVVIKTVRISPLVQVTIGSPRLQPKKRNK